MNANSPGRASDDDPAFQHTVEMGPKPTATAPSPLLRNPDDGPAAISFLELFFDLVYVFALTQISHFLLAHHDPLALVQGAIIFAAVWWAWIYTTWAANWADPEHVQVRIVLLLVMLASLVMAVAIPNAFGEAGLQFALAYIAIQVGRSSYLAWIMIRAGHVSAKSLVRFALHDSGTAALWLAGALIGGGWERLALWGVALAIEYSGPFIGFFLPWLGKSEPRDWVISGHHMAERCALFIIIALGEGIIVTGATFAGQEPGRIGTLAFLAAFTGSVTMWWLYFDVGAKRGAARNEHHDVPGEVARNAYTYLHIPIVAGMIGMAVADEMLLAHPQGHIPPDLVVALCGGAIVYLAGIGGFKRYSNRYGNFPFSHWAGLALFGLLAAWGIYGNGSPLAFAWLAVAILVLVAFWEWFSLHGGWKERYDRHREGRKGG
jgi:low temperature requirement protein LtrA